LYVWNTFLQPLGMNKKNFFCFWMPEVNALEYSEIIGIPDIALFWLWPDGHIASLFQGILFSLLRLRAMSIFQMLRRCHVNALLLRFQVFKKFHIQHFL
jgi:hypothetical protein